MIPKKAIETFNNESEKDIKRMIKDVNWLNTKMPISPHNIFFKVSFNTSVFRKTD
jgi:hypothetical protein